MLSFPARGFTKAPRQSKKQALSPLFSCACMYIYSSVVVGRKELHSTQIFHSTALCSILAVGLMFYSVCNIIFCDTTEAGRPMPAVCVAVLAAAVVVVYMIIISLRNAGRREFNPWDSGQVSAMEFQTSLIPISTLFTSSHLFHSLHLI